MISLGPFVLDDIIGSGGFGQVWRGRHRERPLPVAVKVLTADAAQHPYFLASFRNEARAAAGLDHPNIATVYDYGQVSAAADSASGGSLRMGSPYIVMEMAGGGSLEPWMGRLDWPAVRTVLARLLEALAHAHARGVLHRDLKPGNVLLAGDWAQVKLTDFGLAWTIAQGPEQSTDEGVVGTPAYMAPEQFESATYAYGPWTDLYGLGCLATALITGEPPFGGRPYAMRAMASHLLMPPPPLPAKDGFPAGLGRWVATLLDKDPRCRFQRAADALESLAQISWAPPVTSLHPEGGGPLYTLRASVPSSWRHEGERPGSAAHEQLRGVGLGLVGLRPLPLIGRIAARDDLWTALCEVHSTGRPQIRVLDGLSGYGKSRLVEWHCERAHELGAATVVKAVHGPTGSRQDGIGPALARALGCGSQDATAANVERALARLGLEPESARSEAPALATSLLPELSEPDRADPVERIGGMSRALSLLATDRPVTLWLEDAHWGAESLATVLALLERAERGPVRVLVLITVQDEDIAQRPDEASLLSQLVARFAARRLAVGPLSAAEMASLVRDVLGLDDELAIRVESRAAGNPLYAVQLVQTWAQRGLLRAGPGGFAARGGPRLDLPDDLHQVWAARLEQVLRGRPAGDGVALELAAVLGLDVDGAEWIAACQAISLEAPWDLVEQLLAARLVRGELGQSAASWSFANGLLRASLLRRARESGRARALHAAAAAALRGPVSKPERLGRHLLSAGDPEGAAGPMLDGAQARFGFGGFREAQLLITERERALREAGIPESDSRWPDGWLLMSRCALELGRLDDARMWALRVEQIDDAHAAPAQRAHALWLAAQVLIRKGEGREAVEKLDDARRWAAEGRDARLLAECRLDQGGVMLNLGLLDQAALRFRRAAAEFQSLEDEVGHGRSALGLGLVAAKAGRVEESAASLSLARDCFERAGSRWRMAEALTLLGESARQRGHLAEASAWFDDATVIWRALSAGVDWRLRANIGLLCVARGRHEEARALLDECLAHFELHGHSAMAAVLHACLCASVAALGDWAALDQHLSRAEEGLLETGSVDVDAARMLSLAGRLASSAGHAAPARRAYGLALEQWRSLPRRAEARAVEYALHQLQAGL